MIDNTPTRKQAEVLREIRHFVKVHEHGPSIRALADALGLSVATTHYHLVNLEGKRLIRRTGRAYGIVVETERGAA